MPAPIMRTGESGVAILEGCLCRGERVFERWGEGKRCVKVLDNLSAGEGLTAASCHGSCILRGIYAASGLKPEREHHTGQARRPTT